MKKRNQKICDLPTQSKILCAKFGTYTRNIFASGDDKNNVQIWSFNNQKPLATFSQQSSQSAQVETTAVHFSFSESELFSGSNRGIINVWDVEQQKQLQTLKGHTASINTLTIYPTEENKCLLFSGAYDTVIKLWDLRSRVVANQYKGHAMQINTLAVSPDGKMLASGSHDGLVKVWDIASAKLLTNFNQHDAPVSCLQFNPVDKALASGGGDRCVKYWDLDKFSMITSTRTDTTPVQNIVFDSKGRYLFAAAHESLKAWDLEKDGLLLDNVESTWRGVQDMVISPERDQLLGLATSLQQGFGLYGVSLKQINLEGKTTEQVRTSGGRNSAAVRGKTPEPRQQQQQAAQKQSNNNADSESRLKSKPSFQLQAQNILNQDYNYGNLDRVPSKLDTNESYPPPMYPPQIQVPQIQVPLASIPQQYQQQYTPQYAQQQQQQQFQYQPYMPQQQQQQMQQQYQQPIQQPLQHYNLPPQQQGKFIPTQQVQQLNQFDSVPVQIEEEMKMDEIPQLDNPDLLQSHDELNLSSFIIGEASKERFKQVDIINEIGRDHNKVSSVLQQRLNYMKPILHWWTNSNVKSTVNAINQLTEPSILLDALTMCCTTAKFSQIPIEAIPPLMDKSRILIESKYMSHIKGGLEFIYKVLQQYRDEILSIKLFNQMSKVDLAREERVQKCDKLIEQLKIVIQMPKMQKIIERNKEDVSDLAKKLQLESVAFLKKVSQNQMT